MSSIADIEDKLINTVNKLGIFKGVWSVGRKEVPASIAYPAAYVFFVSERDTGTRPRPVMGLVFEVVIAVKNLKSEKEAARDAYSIMDSVRDALNGKTLEISDIEPFTLVSREIAGYEAGVIEYALRFSTRQYLPVPTE